MYGAFASVLAKSTLLEDLRSQDFLGGQIPCRFPLSAQVCDPRSLHDFPACPTCRNAKSFLNVVRRRSSSLESSSVVKNNRGAPEVYFAAAIRRPLFILNTPDPHRTSFLSCSSFHVGFAASAGLPSRLPPDTRLFLPSFPSSLLPADPSNVTDLDVFVFVGVSNCWTNRLLLDTWESLACGHVLNVGFGRSTHYSVSFINDRPFRRHWSSDVRVQKL